MKSAFYSLLLCAVLPLCGAEFTLADILGTRQTDSNGSEELFMPIEATALGRVMSNNSFFEGSPYLFLLLSSQYESENWKVAGGVFAQKGLPYPELPINHLYLDYYGDDLRIKIGKAVTKVGVLDYFSLLDTINPIRPEFFDDPNGMIKRIPMWMTQADIEPVDNFRLSFYLQPYDSHYHEFTGFYVDYILNRFLPEHYREFFDQDPVGETIFAPLYYDAISPYIARDIDSKLPSSSWRAAKTSLGLSAEYTSDAGKAGVVYFNRYSEIPLIRVDQNLVNAANAYENGDSPWVDLSRYIASLDLDPVKSVEGYRYNLIGVYGETTIREYGVRAEAAYRDKIPLLNSFGSLRALGLGIDTYDQSRYYALETQWLHLNPYDVDGFVAMGRVKSEPFIVDAFKGRLEGRVIGVILDGEVDAAFNPSITVEYGDTSLVLEGIVSQNNSETNSASLLLRTVF